jgi:hypothetical protein
VWLHDLEVLVTTDSTIGSGLVAMGEAPADDPKNYVPDPETFVAAIEETARQTARSLMREDAEQDPKRFNAQ